MTTLHVAVNGADTADGSAGRPFAAIIGGARPARRHRDRPCGRVPGVGAAARGGLSATRRITYMAATASPANTALTTVMEAWR